MDDSVIWLAVEVAGVGLAIGGGLIKFYSTVIRTLQNHEDRLSFIEKRLDRIENKIDNLNNQK